MDSYKVDARLMEEFSRLNNELSTMQRELMQKNVALEERYAQNQVLQERLIAAEREKTLIQTAGGAAHEINQPLTVLMGFLQILLSERNEDVVLVKDLEEMKKATQVIADIVKKMQELRKVETSLYVNGEEIIDFSKSAEV